MSLSKSKKAEAPAAPARSITVSKLFEQRRRSRAAKLLPKSGQNTNLPDVVPRVNLDPILPPMWPHVDKKFDPACPNVRALAHGYKILGAFFSNNYSGTTSADMQGQGFYFAKYTDSYPKVHALKPHMRHVSSDDRFPEELRKDSKLMTPERKQKNIEDLPDSDHEEEEAREEPDPFLEPELNSLLNTSDESYAEPNGTVEEDGEMGDVDMKGEDDPDEEMDMYTDYWKSHLEDDDDDERDDED